MSGLCFNGTRSPPGARRRSLRVEVDLTSPLDSTDPELDPLTPQVHLERGQYLSGRLRRCPVDQRPNNAPAAAFWRPGRRLLGPGAALALVVLPLCRASRRAAERRHLFSRCRQDLCSSSLDAFIFRRYRLQCLYYGPRKLSRNRSIGLLVGYLSLFAGLEVAFVYAIRVSLSAVALVIRLTIASLILWTLPPGWDEGRDGRPTARLRHHLGHPPSRRSHSAISRDLSLQGGHRPVAHLYVGASSVLSLLASSPFPYVADFPLALFCFGRHRRRTDGPSRRRLLHTLTCLQDRL